MKKYTLLAAMLCGCSNGLLDAQQLRVPGSITISVAGDPALPIPFLARTTPNGDVSDQLFLRLGIMGSSFDPSGDKSLTPMLAEKWQRIDSLTLVFTLHPRARWHDGQPVTAHDAVFTWRLSLNPRINSDQPLVEPIASVEEIDPRTFRVRFKRAFSEQLFVVGYGIQLLPAHLLERIPADSIGSSDFVQHPVGNGPYRFVQHATAQYVELRADSTFFRGRPGISRVFFKVIADPQVRMTQLLAGELDVVDNVYPPQDQQLKGQTTYRSALFPANAIAFALFNTRSATDNSKPSLILSDRRVREALTIGVDRANLARSVYGQGASVPEAVRSQAWNWTGSVPAPIFDIAHARAMLDEAGWRDIGADGIRRRAGVPLRLTGIYVPTSGVRTGFAIRTQQLWKELGVDLVLEPVPGASYGQRRAAGTWDIEFGQTSQDASPISLRQSWSCASAEMKETSNIARWCDPTFDKLVNEATTSATPARAWQAAFTRMASERPAAVLGAPLNLVAIHNRYAGVIVWPTKSWLSLWQWRVRPEAALPRDR